EAAPEQPGTKSISVPPQADRPLPGPPPAADGQDRPLPGPPPQQDAGAPPRRETFGYSGDRNPPASDAQPQDRPLPGPPPQQDAGVPPRRENFGYSGDRNAPAAPSDRAPEQPAQGDQAQALIAKAQEFLTDPNQTAQDKLRCVDWLAQQGLKQ